MAKFFASCPIGLSDLVEKELKEMGLQTWAKNSSWCCF
jgi:23S rRNA G2445 N2-methylase RlmL